MLLEWLLSEVLKGGGNDRTNINMFSNCLFILLCLFLTQVCLMHNFKHKFKTTLWLSQHLLQ